MRASRAGLSRIDVLVAVAAILLLMANLLPAVPRARELARKQFCRANLGRIGVALQSYHDVHGVLPPAAFWTAEDLDVSRARHSTRLVEISHANWVQLLLPYLGEQVLSLKFNPTASVTDASNTVARTSELSLFKCPSDPYNGEGNHAVYELEDGTAVAFARGNYAINGGSQFLNEAPGWIWDPHPWGYWPRFNSRTREFQWFGTGVAGYNACVSLKEVENGLATMVAVDEIRAGIAAVDLRGVWALGQNGASVTWAHGIYGDATGPNSQWTNADDGIGCRKLYRQVGRAAVEAARMPCCDHCLEGQQAGARSEHEAGVHVLTLDGAVHFVADAIDPSLWHVMHSREVRGALFPADFEQQLSAPVVESPRVQVPAVAEVAAQSPAAGGLQSSETRGERKPAAVPFVNSLKMKLTPIPPGEFVMGLPDEQPLALTPDEVPAHLVRITHPFWIGAFEVTQGQFETVMGSNPSWHSKRGGGARLVASVDASRLPVESVTWDEAADFCRRLSQRSEERQAGHVYRLPTEAEWEYVCRAGSTKRRKYVSAWDEKETTGEIALKDRRRDHGKIVEMPTTPVGSFPPNAFGVYDMRGNVWEWCQDWFARDYYRHSPQDDPTGPATGYLRVWRGIDWVFTANDCNTSRLWGLEPWIRNPYLGFRVVCTNSGEKGP